MSALETDIAIVGYGPVAAMAALQLADAGLRVTIFERSIEPVVLPRAVGLDGESMRAFQRLGMDGPVAKILHAPREKEQYCFTDSRRRVLFGIEMPTCGHNGWRDNAFFDQPELEALLREHVAREDRIEVSLGCEVTSLDDSGDRVVVATSDGRRVAARWALGCDGASSTVRRSLGIEWESLGYDQDWLVVDITVSPEADLPLTMMQVCDPERLTTYVPGREPNRRWEFQKLPHETREELLEPAKIRALLDPWLAPEHYAIRRSAVYQFHAATAAKLRVGRILLAGDSAHQTPPFLGQGLNSGFRDAVNLGWKLPLVVAGVCDERLLDSYTDERDRHARDLVDRAVGIGQLMETLAAREAGLPDPYPQAAQRAAPGGGGRQIVPPIRGGVLVADQIADDSPVGRTLRQPTLQRAGEAPARLDAHLGRGFAVVGRTASDLEMGAEAAATWRKLGGRGFALEGFDVVDGEIDMLFERHPAALLRPDRYVFGVVDPRHPLDALVSELARSVALR